MNYYLGLDIGGTGVKWVVGNEIIDIFKSGEEPTNAGLGRENILKSIYKIIDQVLLEFKIESIGIGSAGRINTNTGIVEYATSNLDDWIGLNLKDIIEVKYNVKTFVDNDANVALIGEMYKGSGVNYKNAVMITLGTGVGGALFINNEIVNGIGFSAGEFGHTILIPNGLSCNCGKKGCAEVYLSGKALKKQIEDSLNRPLKYKTELFDLYISGNEKAKIILNNYLDLLAIFIENIACSINPEVIIIGGGLINSKDIWFDILKDKCKRLFNVKIVPATLKNDAGAIGAIKIAINGIN